MSQDQEETGRELPEAIQEYGRRLGVLYPYRHVRGQFQAVPTGPRTVGGPWMWDAEKGSHRMPSDEEVRQLGGWGVFQEVPLVCFWEDLPFSVDPLRRLLNLVGLREVEYEVVDGGHIVLRRGDSEVTLQSDAATRGNLAELMPWLASAT